MSNRRDNDIQENSADRIRRRMQRIEEERRNSRPKINPFTLISIGIVLVLALIMSNAIGG
ncbi:MAG: hypothetical protein FWE34_03460 [Defluviitaleaceae bacterium]|nr:hypothetical protein [Defluviitaleaceae bacterium]